MSGGSYDYICHKDIDELINMESTIQDMADDLASLGYASDAAKETQSFLLSLRQCVNRLETMKDRLRPIWKAMEWWQSGDTGEDAFKKSLEKYRV